MKGSAKSSATAAEKINFDCEVVKAKEFDWGVSFDMKVNGVTIYGCIYREGTSKGKDYQVISFPSKKGTDNKYYNEVWFPMSKECKENIIDQLTKLV